MQNDLTDAQSAVEAAVEASARSKRRVQSAREALVGFTGHDDREYRRALSFAENEARAADLALRDARSTLNEVRREIDARRDAETKPAELARLADRQTAVNESLARNIEHTTTLTARSEALDAKGQALDAKNADAVLAGKPIDTAASTKLVLERNAVAAALARLESERVELEAERAAIELEIRDARDSLRVAEGILVRPEAREALAGIADVLQRFVGHHGRDGLHEVLAEVLRDDDDEVLIIREAPGVPSLWGRESEQRASDRTPIREGFGFDGSAFSTRKAATWRGRK